jgi:rubrerythrin
MNAMQNAAITAAINIENRSLGFYYSVMALVNDSNTMKVFEKLAHEGKTHLEMFCNLYEGDRKELVTILNEHNLYANPFYSRLLQSIDAATTETDALRIALEEKQVCIERYTVFLETIREPHAHALFARIISTTREHCTALRKEYRRIMKKVGAVAQICYVRKNLRRSKQLVTNRQYLFQSR